MANVQLGQTVVDKISGFRGVATGRAEYISGCAQVLVGPRVKGEGDLPASQWFDEQRLDVDATITPITLDNGETPGHDIAAPIK